MKGWGVICWSCGLLLLEEEKKDMKETLHQEKKNCEMHDDLGLEGNVNI